MCGALHQLAATARAQAASNDLRIRAARHADDEIGSLTGAFNRMLDTLEERDAALADRARALRESEERLRLALGAATMRTWALPLAATPTRVTNTRWWRRRFSPRSRRQPRSSWVP